MQSLTSGGFSDVYSLASSISFHFWRTSSPIRMDLSGLFIGGVFDVRTVAGAGPSSPGGSALRPSLRPAPRDWFRGGHIVLLPGAALLGAQALVAVPYVPPWDRDDTRRLLPGIGRSARPGERLPASVGELGFRSRSKVR